MNLIIKEVISKNVIDVQSRLDVNDFEFPKKSDENGVKDNSAPKVINESGKRVDKKTNSQEIFVDENGVYQYVVPHCSHCKSTNVTKHDTNLTPIYYNDGKKEHVPVKKYNCKSCGKGSQVEFPDEYKKHSGLPVDLDEKIVKLNSLHWISLNDKRKIIELLTGIRISHEYIRKAQIITEDLFWVNETIVNPDYINYDVQWIPTDEGWLYFHMAVDTKSKKIIAVELTKDEEIKTTKSFLKKVFQVYPKVILSDFKTGYRELFKDDMGMEHQGCTIHFRKSLNRKIRKELNKIKNKIQGMILIENPEITDTALNDKLDEIMEPIREEYWSYKNDVMKAFDYEEYDESSQYIQDLRTKAKNFPKAICNYLTDHFFNIYRSLILYKHPDFKGKIPSNNNLSESKIGWCASKYEKRKYRTDLGFFNHVISRIINGGNI